MGRGGSRGTGVRWGWSWVMASVAAWLRHADASRARTAADGDVPALVRQNVLAQLASLATHPSVARALAGGKVALHGWVYDIPTGRVEDLTAAGPALAA
ncbi:carbonic anhydrase [Nonomuraea sp. WAC 01424]|uniref:carbonic anhydrase n=1 Tax=Nonomuraea sp. WAC 01424 TaxID=2203200 RepID=UPI001C8C48FB|nr:carbonic anhydrase [Nonomuraea sp. WAC 01424]